MAGRVAKSAGRGCQKLFAPRSEAISAPQIAPEPHQPNTLPPGAENKVMHTSLRIGQTTVLVSVGHCQGQPSFQGFSLSLTVDDAAQAERLFAALPEGGGVRMPMAETFFSPRFGMVADRFGVLWMIYVAT